MNRTSAPGRGFNRRHLTLALVVAAAVHALVLGLVVLPSESPHAPRRGSLVLIPRPAIVDVPPDRPYLELTPPGRDEDPRREAAPPPAEVVGPTVPLFRPSPAAAEDVTIPSTALRDVRGAALPLVVTDIGTIGRRRLEESEERLAVARAESLLMARLADLGLPRPRDTGTLGLSGGGVTLAVPWQGFLPADRHDETWRERRCAEGGRENDKPGEAEARRSQCS